MVSQKSKILISLLFLLSLNVMANDEKIYTQAEFDQKLKELNEKAIDRLKTTSIATLTKELLEKEQELKKFETKLSQREEMLKQNEQSLSKQIQELNKKSQELIGCVDKNEAKKNQRIAKLVKMISSMKPAKAAEVLSVQDRSLSVKILEKIDPTRASKIFNVMDKEVSAQLQKQYLNMQK